MSGLRKWLDRLNWVAGKILVPAICLLIGLHIGHDRGAQSTIKLAVAGCVYAIDKMQAPRAAMENPK